MEEKEKKYLEFLLADFSAVKAEIARRSNLQKAVIVAMFAFYAWVFQRLLESGLEIRIVVVSWVVAFLGYTYSLRESAEINRLAWLIKNNISAPAGKLLGREPEEVIPSEGHAREPIDFSRRKLISNIFKVVIYLLAPIYITLVFAHANYCT